MPLFARDQIENWFTYHAPTPEQQVKYVNLREAGKTLALAIWENCPPGADASAAVRKVREAVMTANQAIACEPERGDDGTSQGR